MQDNGEESTMYEMKTNETQRLVREGKKLGLDQF